MTAQSIQAVADELRAHRAEFTQAANQKPDSPLADAIVQLVDHTDLDGHVPESIATSWLQHAAAAESLGVSRDYYLTLADASRSALRHICADLPFAEVLGAERAITSIANTLSSAPLPNAAVPAQVVQVEKRSSAISVVRLQAETAINYTTTQYVTVTADYLRGARRELFPTIPPNEYGQIEFHIRHEGMISTLLAGAHVGDTWWISTGQGGFDYLENQDMVFIAHGVGLAALRPIIVDFLRLAEPPRVHLFLAADYPGELYELAGLWSLASTAPWLSVTPVVAHEEDAWWVAPTQHSHPPRGLHITQVGQAGEIVAGYGTWEDRRILIAGPSHDVAASRKALIRRGTPPTIIHTQTFDYSPFWL